MFWSFIFQKIIIKKKIGFFNFKKLNQNWQTKKKINKTIIKYNQKDNFELIRSYISCKKYEIKIRKIDYKFVIFKKNTIDKKIQFENFFNISLKKKQTFTNVSINLKNKFSLSNGVILKSNDILEKSRKKDLKFSIINIIKSIDFIKANLKFKNDIFILINRIKPFLNKINKTIKNELKNSKIKIHFIIKPCISFGSNRFKKVKSIKRRLRKKYTLLDV